MFAHCKFLRSFQRVRSIIKRQSFVNIIAYIYIENVVVLARLEIFITFILFTSHSDPVTAASALGVHYLSN